MFIHCSDILNVGTKHHTSLSPITFGLCPLYVDECLPAAARLPWLQLKVMYVELKNGSNLNTTPESE